MKPLQIEYHKAKNAANKLKHQGISLAEAEALFHDKKALTRHDDDHDEQRWLTMGMDAKGRILVVAYTYRDPDSLRIISARRATKNEQRQYWENRTMKEEYDFSSAKRGAVASGKGKTRITIMLDDAVLEAARALAESEGLGYQTVINGTLRRALLGDGVGTAAVAFSAVGNAGRFKEGITASELKSLEQKLSEVLKEIHRVMQA